MLGFAPSVLLVGVLLLTASALSGWLRGTVLSVTVLAVVAGAGLSLAGLLEVTPDAPWLSHVIELALILTLFSDGLTAEHELVRRRWRDPARALAVAMPITLGLIALAAKALFPELSWAEALLLGAVLAPTDPVVTSTVVTSTRVPAAVRHTLNLESGLNDGLALPFVLVFLVVAAPGGDASASAFDVVLESVVGAGVGAAVALASAKLLDRLPGGSMEERYEGVYALAIALVAFGLADATIGNGLVATFVAALVLGAARAELPRAFPRFNENLSTILQVVAFVLFGALIVTTGFENSVLALLGFIVFVLAAARPIAIAASMRRSELSRPEKIFIAWFGPKGVASMLFALYVLESQAPDRSLVFDIAAFVILGSVLAHGLTDTIGARWVERRMERADRP